MEWGEAFAGALIAIVGGLVGGVIAYYFRQRELRRQDRRDVYARFVRTLYEAPHRLMMADHTGDPHLARHGFLRDVNLVQAELELYASDPVVGSAEAYVQRVTGADIVALFDGALSAAEILEKFHSATNPLLNELILKMRRDLGNKAVAIGAPNKAYIAD